MKKLILCIALAIFGMINLNAQSKFGVTAGYTNITLKASFEGDSASSSESGFYVGVLGDFSISEKFHIQPEVLYASASETNFLYIPVLAKIMVSDKFALLAGPQANIVLEDLGGEINTLGIDLTFGLAYDIDENFFIDARYSSEITNRIKDAGDVEDVKLRFNTLNIGVGYRF